MQINQDLLGSIPSDVSNLKTHVNKMLGTVLWSGSSDLGSSITLSDSIVNYNRIDIVYTYTLQPSTYVATIYPTSSGVYTVLQAQYTQTGAGKSQGFPFKKIFVNAKTISRIDYGTWWTDSGTILGDQINIIKVIGYKE